MEFCSIASGSSGNSIYIGSDDTRLLVDAGISKKRIVEGLGSFGQSLDNIDAVLITHEHIDHIKSLGVLIRACSMPIYCTKGTLEGIKCYNLGKMDYSRFRVIDSDEVFYIGDIRVEAIKTSHDANDSCGFRFDCDGKSFAIVTDLGYYDTSLVKRLQDLNGILLESNHDIRMLEAGPYPYPLKKRIFGDRGHLSNDQAGELLNEILNPELKCICLGHLSKENNYPRLAYETVKLEVTYNRSNEYNGDDLNIMVAKRDSCSSKIDI